MADVSKPEQGETADAPPGASEQAPGGWQTARNGRHFYRLPGTGGYQGIVWRKGGESLDDAIARHRKGGADKAPKSKRARSKGRGKDVAYTPPVSRDETTRKIQTLCEDVLCSPSYPFAMFGFEWEADHFSNQGERFAANVARSSERNPWLRKFLERGIEGEQNVVAVLTSFNLSLGAIAYVAPPLMKWGVLPAPDTAKRAFGVPLPRMAPPPPPRPVYETPPVVDAAESVVSAWEKAQAMSEGQANPIDLTSYAPGHGDNGAGVPASSPQQGVPQPPAPFADQVS